MFVEYLKDLDQLEEAHTLKEELSKGIFWIVNPEDMESNKRYCFPIPCNPDGVPDSYEGLNSKTGETYNHKKYWSMLDKSYTHNKEYNYYPRGRVEINHGRATIYLNPNIASDKVLDFISKQFSLTKLNGIQSVRLFPDGSEHYKCYLDY